MNTVTIIAQEVSRITGISIFDMLSERREAPIIDARHMAIALTKEFTPFGSAKVAKAWKRADHTSILHAYRVWPERMQKRGLHVKFGEAREAVRARILTRRVSDVDIAPTRP